MDADDLPVQYLSLMRQVIRDCRSPGQYEIALTIPHYPNEPLSVVISRKEVVRTAVYGKARPVRKQ